MQQASPGGFELTVLSCNLEKPLDMECEFWCVQRGWFELDAASQSHLRDFGGSWTPNTRSPAPEVVMISGESEDDCSLPPAFVGELRLL